MAVPLRPTKVLPIKPGWRLPSPLLLQPSSKGPARFSTSLFTTLFTNPRFASSCCFSSPSVASRDPQRLLKGFGPVQREPRHSQPEDAPADRCGRLGLSCRVSSLSHPEELGYHTTRPTVFYLLPRGSPELLLQRWAGPPLSLRPVLFWLLLVRLGLVPLVPGVGF